MIPNPYTQARRANDSQVARWGPMIADRLGIKLDDFNRTMTKGVLDHKEARKRVQYAQMMRIAEATAFQIATALDGVAPFIGMSRGDVRRAVLSAEVAAGTGALADIVTFTTQQLHMSLDIFPRLLSNLLVSIQPLTQPSGYVFFRKHYDQNNRELSDLATFEEDFTEDPGGGEQIVDKVRTTIESELVEAEYRKILQETTWEVEVKARTTFGLELEPINDQLMTEQLIWTTDRTVINRLKNFAGRDYTFDPTDAGNYATKDDINRRAYDETFLSQTMADVETDMQAVIFRRPNWAIAGNGVIKFLKRLRKYSARKNGFDYGDMIMGNGSVEFAGHLDDLAVYHDPQLDECLMLVGYTDPNDPFYAGYLHCPFAAGGIMTAAFRDPNTLLSRKAQAIAFGTHGVRSEQYARVWIEECS